MFRVIQYFGNRELLTRRKTLFVCSKRAPIATYEKIFEWVESMSASKNHLETKSGVVVCCNTSELEQEVMKSLVVNRVPTILVVMNRFRDENNIQIQKALAENKMLVVVMKQTDKKRWSPRDRNEFLINQMADNIVTGYIDKNGGIFPLLAGRANTKSLTDNQTLDTAAESNRSYQRWTVGQDKTLLRMYYEDYSIHEIKKQLNRSYISVRDRIRAITMPEDVLKGREFEELILELLDIKHGKYVLKEWRGDKTMGDVYPKSNTYPDFVVEVTETKKRIAIECKWRQTLNHTVMADLFSLEQLNHYQEFSKEQNIPVFIVIGIGGYPCEPNDIYIVPMEKASSTANKGKNNLSVLLCEPLLLDTFKRKVTDAPFSSTEFPV